MTTAARSTATDALPDAEPPRSVLRRVVPPALVIALLLLLALGAWTAIEAARAVGAARDGRSAAAQLQTELSAGSWDAAAGTAQRLGADVDRMAKTLDSPPLRLAGVAPVVGRDVRAAREVTLGLQEASRGVQPLLTAARGLTPSSLLSKDGLERLQTLAPLVARADQSLAAAQQRIGAIDPATLHEPLRSEVVDLQARLTELRRQGVRSPALTG